MSQRLVATVGITRARLSVHGADAHRGRRATGGLIGAAVSADRVDAALAALIADVQANSAASLTASTNSNRARARRRPHQRTGVRGDDRERHRPHSAAHRRYPLRASSQARCSSHAGDQLGNERRMPKSPDDGQRGHRCPATVASPSSGRPCDHTSARRADCESDQCATADHLGRAVVWSPHRCGGKCDDQVAATNLPIGIGVMARNVVVRACRSVSITCLRPQALEAPPRPSSAPLTRRSRMSVSCSRVVASALVPRARRRCCGGRPREGGVVVGGS